MGTCCRLSGLLGHKGPEGPTGPSTSPGSWRKKLSLKRLSLKRKAIAITLHNGLHCGWAPPAHGQPALVASWAAGAGAFGEPAQRRQTEVPTRPSPPLATHPPSSVLRPSSPSLQQSRALNSGKSRESLPHPGGRLGLPGCSTEKHRISLSAMTEMWPSFVILSLVWDCCYSQYYFVVFFNVLTTFCQQRWDVSSHSPHAMGSGSSSSRCPPERRASRF